MCFAYSGGFRGGRGAPGGGQGGLGGGRDGGSGFVPGRPTSNKKEPLKFDKEYDFEHANEEFQGLLQKLQKTSLDKEEGDDKAEVAAEGGEGAQKADGGASEAPEEGEIVDKEGGEANPTSAEEEPPQIFYDKKKSFFDTIRCGVLSLAG